MVEYIRSSFIQELQNADWMDNTTRLYAIEKAKAMRVNMAYPDWMMKDGKPDEAALLKFYDNVCF